MICCKTCGLPHPNAYKAELCHVSHFAKKSRRPPLFIHFVCLYCGSPVAYGGAPCDVCEGRA